MKIRCFYVIIFSVIFSLGLTQCTHGATIAPINTAESTLTPAFTSTKPQTPTATQTPIATPTFTALPTLNPTEEQANILALLKSNGGCNLPCWWGVTPGKTTKSEAEQIFRELRLELIDYIPRKLPGTNWTGYEKGYSLEFSDGILDRLVDFRLQNDLVKNIRINSIFSPNGPAINSSAFKNVFAAFAPEKIIPELGIPSRISIDPVLGGEGPSIDLEYYLYIIYDQLGVRLMYIVRGDLSDKYKVCPTFGSGGNTEDSIGILLASPNDNVPIETYDESGVQARAISIEKAAGITPEEFYNLFTQSAKPICFNVLPSVLPVP